MTQYMEDRLPEQIIQILEGLDADNPKLFFNIIPEIRDTLDTIDYKIVFCQGLNKNAKDRIQLRYGIMGFTGNVTFEDKIETINTIKQYGDILTGLGFDVSLRLNGKVMDKVDERLFLKHHFVPMNFQKHITPLDTSKLYHNETELVQLKYVKKN